MGSQSGIWAVGTAAHRHLEFTVEDEARLGPALARLPEVTGVVVNVHVVVGVGDRVAQELFGDGAPRVPPVPELEGVPHTPRDLWVWVHGIDRGSVFDVARLVTTHLAGVATPVHALDCFVYHDNRDLMGFVDGSANPSPAEASSGVATIATGAAGAGGSFAITQTWVHDLDAFDQLAVEDQERVFGRTKPDSIELAGDAKPVDAHNSRVEIEEDGEELQVFRRSVPYTTGPVAGLHFVGFARRGDIFPRMLGRMFGAEDGVRDHMVSFTTPVTGATWFVPTVEQLAGLA